MDSKKALTCIVICFLLSASGCKQQMPGQFQELPLNNPCEGKPERWVYRTKEKGKEWTTVVENSFYETGEYGSELTVISKPQGGTSVTTMTMAARTMKPVLIAVAGETEIVCEARYYKPYIFLRFKTFHAKKPWQKKKITNTSVTYDQRSLFWLLRGYPFTDPQEVKLDIVMPLGNRCSMKIRYLGRENITVPAGTFKAYKLEMQPDALLPMFSKDLETYFWYSVERTPKFLKYEHENRGYVAELTEHSFLN